MRNFWRAAHLALACFASLFLLSAAVSGLIIAADNLRYHVPFKGNSGDFGDISLARSLPVLQKKFPEITSLEIKRPGELILNGTDASGKEVHAVVDPVSGEILGKPHEDSKFITQVTSLHRSLFLHESGRFVTGIAAFFLLLISVSGFALVLKRQGGLAHYFGKISKEKLPNFLHVASGRLMLPVIIVIAGTGTMLFMKRFKLWPKEKIAVAVLLHAAQKTAAAKPADFEIFKKTRLSDVQKIEFPFMADDPEDFFDVKLTSGELKIKQGTGEILKETRKNWPDTLHTLAKNIHTGKSSWWWSLVLAFGAANILVFIYSGFAIFFSRKKPRIKNKFGASESEIIILTGSESGTVTAFAAKVYRQLIAKSQKVYFAELNDFQPFPNAKELLIFTSTYGNGEAPGNARDFFSLLKKYPFSTPARYSVVGFGDDFYENFCGFAKDVAAVLASDPLLSPGTGLHTVNRASAYDFVVWAKDFNKKNGFAISEDAPYYALAKKKPHIFRVISKTNASDDNENFHILLKPPPFQKFNSGDILTVFIGDTSLQRPYSIGKIDKNIGLFVKFHRQGAGSGFLHGLSEGDKVRGFIRENPSFRFPKNAAAVIMIANGTGIAPYLGMLGKDFNKTKKYLYCGFRHETAQTRELQNLLQKKKDSGLLEGFIMAFSNGATAKYVTDLISTDEDFFAAHLRKGGVIMICGSLAMQYDVEKLLGKISEKHGLPSVSELKSSAKLLTDCY